MFELTVFELTVFKLTVFELTMHFKHEMIEIWKKISKKLRMKWNLESTMFELTVPDLYPVQCCN